VTSAVRPGRPLSPGRFLVLISVRGKVDSNAIMRLEGLGQLKTPVTLWGLEPATFWLVSTNYAIACPREEEQYVVHIISMKYVKAEII
jgi:hypothetical protein